MKGNSFFTIAAGLSGAIAVGLGAYGAHGLKGVTNEFKEIWKVLFSLFISIFLIN